MSKLRYESRLSIGHRGKGVPYGRVERRSDGDTNYGFVDLKGHPELFESVPELSRDPHLMELARVINSPETDLFSIGCTSGDVSDSHGHRRTGYVEFAFNSIGLVSDASSYFPAFFHFDQLLFATESDAQIRYDWELEPASFIETGTDGFTCTVVVNTNYTSTAESATVHWAEALQLLSMLLGSVRQSSTDVIYAPGN